MNAELATIETPQAIQHVDEPRNLMSVIARAVMGGTTSVEVMQCLLDMQLKVENRQAEVEFNAALARMMPKLPRIEKSGVILNKDGTSIRSRYAYYSDIDLAIRPFLAEEGFSFSFNTDDSTPTHLKMTGTLSHRLGHSRSSTFTVPTQNPVITGGQAVGAANEFAKRYIVVNMLNIVTVGADKDGQEEPKFITDAQVLQIEMLLTDLGADLKKFLVWANVEKLSDIREENFSNCVKTIQAKGRK